MERSAKATLWFLTIFVASIIGGACVHELGHGIAGWMQGVAVVPTPFKEYVLQEEMDWRQQAWIALGGVAGTVLLVAGVLIWYIHKDGVYSDPVLAGVLLTPFAYTVRFLLVGRGHDGLEWQAAQAALGLSPSGHAVDIVFLVLVVLGIIMWIVLRHTSLNLSTLARAGGLVVIGIVVLVVLQVSNNAMFDGFFPNVRIVNVPAVLKAE